MELEQFQQDYLLSILEHMVISIFFIISKLQTQYLVKNIHLFKPYSTTTIMMHFSYPFICSQSKIHKINSKAQSLLDQLPHSM